MKVRIDPLDKLFSEYIRQRSKGYCERCGKYYGWKNLQCCHFHSRAEHSIRFDGDNACSCCFGDHQYLDSHPMEKIDFFLKRLGQDKFDLLNARRRIREKPDRQALTLYYRAEIKKLEAQS